MIFIDTNVLVYAVLPGSEWHEPCRTILRAVALGDLPATTNTLVIEELWHLETARKLVPAGVAEAAFGVFPGVAAVNESTLLAAFRLDGVDGLGTADRIHAATCRLERLDTIVTADVAFDAVRWLARVEPTAAGAQRLLAAAAASAADG